MRSRRWPLAVVVAGLFVLLSSFYMLDQEHPVELIAPRSALIFQAPPAAPPARMRRSSRMLRRPVVGKNATHSVHASAPSGRAVAMDYEAGVRLGSLCPDESTSPRRRIAAPCSVAADIFSALDTAAARQEQAADSALCLFTSLTDAYVEGHLVFMRSALRRSPSLQSGKLPLYVLDQALSTKSRARVAASYSPTRWVQPRGTAKDVRTVTKFALNKEKTALFTLRAACGAVLKLDTGDMLVTGDLEALLTHPAVHEASTGVSRTVWATQAMGQPKGKLNGGLMLFGR